MTLRAFVISAALLAGLCHFCVGAEQRPSVLFCGGVHNAYVTKPLVAMGIDVDACNEDQLPQRLESGKYNVVVIATVTDASRTALDAFMARGGGVFVSNPAEHPQAERWTRTNEWLAALGARPRWEVLKDSNKDNVARDVMGCALSWSDKVSAPFNEGVRGVLTLMWGSTTGCEPPMSFDLGPDWKAVVRGADSMTSEPSIRQDVVLQPWIPKEGAGPSPPLMAVREVGKGRIAVMAIRYYWILTPPGNCPTAEVMLTAGAGGKPSDWLRVFANTFRWLAEPSLKAGMGGAGTPQDVLDPPVKPWDIPGVMDWGDLVMPGDQPQVTGLIGARTALSTGKGSVADYAKAAKEAGLQFIVFLEDSMHMDQAAWDKLVKECDAASDENFSAVPGLTYEDAQGDHLYAFADEVQFPKPEMLLPDRRLATTQTMRSRAYFDYVNELMRQHIISGFWRHKENYVHVADYKLYNSFPVYSFEDGKPVDDALDDYLYFQGIGGCHSVLAFEMMSSPEQVARRAKEGWRVVWNRGVKNLRGEWHHGAWSFHGMMSQYITNGPSILVWQAPNRLVGPNGLWWRPDLWEFRLQLRVASEAGLKSVTVHDGDRSIFHRWLPGGAKTFEQQLVLSNCQQLGLTLVVEDMQGRRAISMQSWNRNLNLEEFFCSDRCNFLGNSRLRSRRGSQAWTQVSFKGNMGITPSKGNLDLSCAPAVFLTFDSPTLPIDGAPAGFPTVNLQFGAAVQDELRYIFAYPITYMVGPEIAVGQSNYLLGYDPAEEKAEKTPLGHLYEQPQQGTGNAWGSWHKLIPTRKLSGFARTWACVWMPGEFRIGWHESDLTMKDTVTLQNNCFQVMYPSMPGWVFYRDGKPVAEPGTDVPDAEFSRGTFAVLEHLGGCVVVTPLEGPIHYAYSKNGSFRLSYAAGKPELQKGDRARYQIAFAGASGITTTAQMLEFAEKFGIAHPGTAGYKPEIKSGKQIDNYLIWQLDGQGVGIDARIPKTAMPGFLPVCVENLNDNWSVQLLDRRRLALLSKQPDATNAVTGAYRALPIRDRRAYAQLDLNEDDLDVFIGHPVTADNADVKLVVAWQQPGKWFVEVNNPTDKALKTTLTSSPGWTLFKFKETVDLAPGGSKTWTVPEAKK